MAQQDQAYISVYETPDVTPDASDESTLPSPFCTSLSSSSTDLNGLLTNYALSPDKLAKIRDDLVCIARAAGEMMKAADPSISGFDSKRNTSDLVTETDRAIENMVCRRLQLTHPTINFLGEETFKEGQKLSDEPTFICDPIDGTLNFIHGFPNTAISLALAIAKKPVVGVVYNPFRDDLFTTVKGQGAYYTNADDIVRSLPIRPVLPPLSLHKSLVAIEWGNQRDGPNWDLRSSVAHRLLSSKAAGGAMVHSTRSSGSAALDFCYVAAGMMDAFWEGGCWAWDVAAGWCILEEAGGIVASANPGDWKPELEGRLYFAVRAAKRDEQRAVVEELWRLMAGRKFVF
ncbi:inositol monophosphatase [Polyplosphaeria fusca]|uniref:Inositol-1-monophosphatase n=1 Tax=Polyplosphaeria fusca TaxID=682080 RepID=A0A9P4V299_9PLEO|nr:inositol monophosphatase [Polyplosphaeria fusca]